MAEQVNKRIEDMINELEQMKRINLYNDEEIRDISRKRRDFEYKIQRQTKLKEDFVNYIAYELALLEDISLRRKQAKLGEKKKDIEYAIAKRLNKIFKQFINRFQNDIEVYFQYIKFCRSVGFDYAISSVIGQMLQFYGDKPKMWQMASRWEKDEQNNVDNAKQFLLKGIHRHPDSDILYLELFNIELLLAFKADDDELKEKQLKRADVVWRNGLKNIRDVNFLFKIYDTSMKYEIADTITKDVKTEIWSHCNVKEVWSFIAAKELVNCHWEEIEEFIDEDCNLSTPLKNFVSIYEEALLRFPDEKLCTKYIHELLSVSDSVCTGLAKITAVKRAWMFGHEHSLLTNDMYSFGIEMLKIENELSRDEITEILNVAVEKKPTFIYLWEEILLLCKSDEKEMYSVLKNATKVLSSEDLLKLCNVMLDNVDSSDMVNNLYKKFQNCESSIFLAVKPKLLQKMYEYSGLKAARALYDEFIRTPPLQLEVHTIMISIEKSQEKLNNKQLTKCYEYMTQYHGQVNYEIWLDYMKFEREYGNVMSVPNIHRRAIAALKKELVEEFIKAHTLLNLK